MNHPYFAQFPEAQFLEHQGHSIPLQITKPEQIVDWGRLFMPFPRPPIKISGEDRCSFLNGLGPTDLRQFNPGDGTRCLFTNAHGHVIFDTYVAAFDDHLLLFVDPGEETKLLKHLSFNAIMDKVAFELLESKVDLAFIFGAFVPAPTQRVLEQREGYTVVFSDETLFSTLQQSGFTPIGFALFEELRPMYQVARSGADFGAGQLPQEAGLESCMEFQKGCYLGQEPISRVTFRGRLQNRLEQLCSAEPLEPGCPITYQGKQVGQVTTASHLEGPKGFFSLGYIKTKLADEPELVLFAGEQKITVPRYLEKKA